MNPPCALCTLCAQRGHPCRHRADAIAFTKNAWHEHDVTATGHSIPNDTNGLQLHHQRVMIPYIRSQRVLEGTEAA